MQTLSKLRQNDECYYVDKTPKIIEMIGKSDYIFLSRPRRFGKSLTLDTVAELFCANKDLFIGLYAENHWDWTVKHPVIRISFGGNVSFDEQYLQRIFNRLLSKP
ncbi:AAA family ATPase [Moraxella lacunata]|uniref:AAA family ATPase n=2 Tax=Moraxella lacunata TaxID=477 RepID=UPI002244A2E6|nr:AAA family ATPase [Moraxella lacunata]